MGSSAPRILYTDNNADSLELISLMLRLADNDYEITSVLNPNEALELIESQPAFDLYILEYVLTGMSGVELCRRIRRSDATTPVLFFTAMARASDRAAALEAGANEYLVKPNDLAILTQTVRQLLSEKSLQPLV
ncbi:MAG TPA: response regulator [Pyrinomonadaceae bacterium]|nr:response regulator [Pyrinomonadaceae bacterium]